MRASVMVLLIASGCSFVAVDAPAKIPTTYKLRCSPLAPIADTVFLGAGGVLMYELRTSGSASSAPAAAVASALTGVVVIAMVGNGLGAIYGWSTWPRCRRLRDAPPIEYAKAFGDEAVKRARAGDCARAMELGVQARAFDQHYYAHTFLSEPDIVLCVAKANAEYQQQHAARIQHDETASRRSTAQQLVKQARDAARAGECNSVSALGARILALDAHTHEVWFVKDAEIAACLRK